MTNKGADKGAQSILALVGIALVCATLLAGTRALTAPQITANHAMLAQNELRALLGKEVVSVPEDWIDGLWQRCDGSLIARTQVAGYAGPIELLAALTGNPAERLSGVRITRHQETAGIADFLNRPDAGWLAALADSTVSDLTARDAVTGATITSKAVLAALIETTTRAAASQTRCES